MKKKGKLICNKFKPNVAFKCCTAQTGSTRQSHLMVLIILYNSLTSEV